MPVPWTRRAIVELARNYQGAAILAAATDLDLFATRALQPCGSTRWPALGLLDKSRDTPHLKSRDSRTSMGSRPCESV